MSGKLIGGCLPSLCQFRGTEYDYDYNNAVLMLDFPEGEVLGKGLPLRRIESQIEDLANHKTWEKIDGLLVARPFRQTAEDTLKIKEVIRKVAKRYAIPALFGVDIGHSDPMCTLPIGGYVHVKDTRNEIEVVRDIFK